MGHSVLVQSGSNMQYANTQTRRQPFSASKKVCATHSPQNSPYSNPIPQKKNIMITKLILLTFLVYTAVSGQEEDRANGLATLDSSRRFDRWLHPLESSAIAESPTAILNQFRAAAANETHTYLRGHTDILTVESANTALAQHKIEEGDDNGETSRRHLRHRKKNNKKKRRRRRKKRREKRMQKNRHGLFDSSHGLFHWPVNAAKKSWIKLQKQTLKLQKQLQKKNQQLNKQLQTKNQNPQQLDLKSNANAAPCAGTSNSICAVFNVGADTSDGSTNGSSSGNVDNGSSINGNSLEKQNKMIVNGNDLPEETDEPATLEPTFPTFEWIKLDDRQHRAYDYFGRSIAVDENTIVVGAPSDDELAWQNKGFVSVFYQGAAGEWELQQDLPTPDGVHLEGGLFGYSVAIHGNTIVAGAPGVGIVQVYTRPEPGEVFTKSGSPLQSHKMGNFGESVAVFGNTIVVGAPTENHSGKVKAGSVYVYVRNGNEWDFEQELFANGPSNHEYFGTSVAIYHNTLIVGMPGHGSFEKGGAQVFHRDNGVWDYDGTPIATGLGDGEAHYGRNVDIHREIVAVGGDIIVPPKVFEKDFTHAWVPLGYSSLTTGSIAVAVDHDQGNNDDILVVGGYNKVKIFYHEDNQWNENEDLPTQPYYFVDDGDAFGASVAISEGYVVAGAPMTHSGGLSPVGEVFVMDLNGAATSSSSTWDGEGEDDFDYDDE